MECPICQTTITQGEVTLKCKHKICVPCFTQWARRANTCPCCRDEFAAKPEPPKQIVKSKKITSAKAASIIQEHRDNLNDYCKIRLKILEKKTTQAEKIAVLDSMIDWNIRNVGNRFCNWYEN